MYLKLFHWVLYWPRAKHIILFIPFLLKSFFLFSSYLIFSFFSLLKLISFFFIFYSHSFHHIQCFLLSSSSLSLSFYHIGHSSALFFPLSILCIKMLVLSCPTQSNPILSSLLLHISQNIVALSHHLRSPSFLSKEIIFYQQDWSIPSLSLILS